MATEGCQVEKVQSIYKGCIGLDELKGNLKDVIFKTLTKFTVCK